MVSTPHETIDLRIQKGAKKQDHLLLTLCLLLTHLRVVLCPYAEAHIVKGSVHSLGGSGWQGRCQSADLLCRYRGVGKAYGYS